MKFPLYEIFRPLYEYFLALLGVHEYFSFNFPLREYIYFSYFVPPLPPPNSPPISFLMSRPLIMNMYKSFTWVICVNGEHPSFINVNYAIRARRLKGR